MTREEVAEQLNNLAKANTEDALNQSQDIILNRLKENIDEEERVDLQRRLVFVKAGKMQYEIQKVKDPAEEVHLRGKLVKHFKDAMKGEKDQDVVFQYRLFMIEELKRHKEAIQKAKNSNTKIPITKKLGMFVKDIADSIEIFWNENDIGTKAKNVAKETVRGATSTFALVGGVGLAVQAIAGIPLSLASIISVAPVLAYTCLSSIIRNVTGKTEFQNYLYHQSDDYKALVSSFTQMHQKEIQAINDLSKSKEGKNIEEKILINEELIKKLDALVDSTDVNGIKHVFQLQALSCFRENKEYREQIKDDYLEEKNDDKEKYVENNKKLAEINMEIFKRGNSIKEAIQNAGKNIVNNAKVMLVAKAILACVAPGTFGIHSARSILEPLAFAVVNGIIDIPTYQNKLKFLETEYEGIVKVKNKKRIEEILGEKQAKAAPVYA